MPFDGRPQSGSSFSSPDRTEGGLSFGEIWFFQFVVYSACGGTGNCNRWLKHKSHVAKTGFRKFPASHGGFCPEGTDDHSPVLMRINVTRSIDAGKLNFYLIDAWGSAFFFSPWFRPTLALTSSVVIGCYRGSAHSIRVWCVIREETVDNCESCHLFSSTMTNSWMSDMNLLEQRDGAEIDTSESPECYDSPSNRSEVFWRQASFMNFLFHRLTHYSTGRLFILYKCMRALSLLQWIKRER